MKLKLKRAFQAEMQHAMRYYKIGDYTAAFYHLERSHILGQSYVIPHTKSHWWMLKIGLKTKSGKEVLGQLMRILASILFSRLWVPIGNTGGTNVSPLKAMPIPQDLRSLLDD
ncbi:DUF3703 domain-containing protein [Ferrimonas lipolytica]|uniref:DUF3703 domain-containing protein n=1 Tax=Ferrimonas lipolytica TaxID=2724191 RepID=A0A6H1UD73_9GAMM|nr:DUF3703 domain-containing protein [Ferrimonas lipolytica]QIZ75752.1 DUF3703 domain-containing protein [Ferrimonas lipolytica]